MPPQSSKTGSSLSPSPPFTPGSSFGNNKTIGWGPGTSRPWRESSSSSQHQNGRRALGPQSRHEIWKPGQSQDENQASDNTWTYFRSLPGQTDSVTSHSYERFNTGTTPVSGHSGQTNNVQAWNRPSSERHPNGNLLSHPAEVPNSSRLPLLDRLTDNTESRGSFGTRPSPWSGDRHADTTLRNPEASTGAARGASLQLDHLPRLRTAPGSIQSLELVPWQAAPGAQSSAGSVQCRGGMFGSFDRVSPSAGGHPSPSTELQAALAGMNLSDFEKGSNSSVRTPYGRSNSYVSNSSPFEGSLSSDQGLSNGRQPAKDGYWPKDAFHNAEYQDRRSLINGSAGFHKSAYPSKGFDSDKEREMMLTSGAHSRAAEGTPCPENALRRARADPNGGRYLNGALASQDQRLERLKEEQEQWCQWYACSMMQQSQSNSMTGLSSSLVPYGLPPGMPHGTPFPSARPLPEMMMGNVSVPRALPDLGPGHGVRSTLLEEFKTLTSSKSSRHFELKVNDEVMWHAIC